MGGIWVFSERRENILELLNIGRELAVKMQVSVTVLLCVDHERAKEYILHGADEILLIPPGAIDHTMDGYIPLIVDEAKKVDPDLILIAATTRGKELAARMACRLDTGLCSSCLSIRFNEQEKTLEMERLAYGGVAIQKVLCTSRPAMATIPPRTYEPARTVEGKEGIIRALRSPADSPVKVLQKKKKERETKDLTEARLIVCIGRGIEKKEDIELVRQLAEVMGGEIACTRPIAEEYHWLPEEMCIGLSGIQVKPNLYLGLGVSGQVQHVTGIRNAKIIAAVNKDENAPIFRTADLGIVGDLYDVVPKLIAEFKK